MSYISAKEAAQKWCISERMVYKYCTQNRIPEAYQDYGIWFIPEDAAKPSRIKKDTVNTPQIPPLLKNLIKQRDGRQYRGLYDYIQINMVYSNGRMASNRLTRNQIEMLYKPTASSPAAKQSRSMISSKQEITSLLSIWF